MLEVYLSPKDFAPYYEVGDFPFNFELIFYNRDVTADIVLNKITNTLENLPEGKKANWVVSFKRWIFFLSRGRKIGIFECV